MSDFTKLRHLIAWPLVAALAAGCGGDGGEGEAESGAGDDDFQVVQELSPLGLVLFSAL